MHAQCSIQELDVGGGTVSYVGMNVGMTSQAPSSGASVIVCARTRSPCWDHHNHHGNMACVHARAGTCPALAFCWDKGVRGEVVTCLCAPMGLAIKPANILTYESGQPWDNLGTVCRGRGMRMHRLWHVRMHVQMEMLPKHSVTAPPVTQFALRWPLQTRVLCWTSWCRL